MGLIKGSVRITLIRFKNKIHENIIDLAFSIFN